MTRVILQAEDDWDGWRAAVRSLVAQGTPPEAVTWQVGDAAADLFGDATLTGNATVSGSDRPSFNVPRDFVSLARRAILHRDPERFALLHGLLLRVLDQPMALRDRSDRRTRKVEAMYQTIRRDMHKMRAFVRFREIDGHYVAWFEPEHHILRANAPFFAGRFTGMTWSIVTPDGSIHWDGHTLRDGPGADGPGDGADPVEAMWKAYYSATFNPARLRPNAMQKEMPRKYWANLPEAALIPGLIAGAATRERQMLEKAPTVPGKGR